jgi:hypothetical protein
VSLTPAGAALAKHAGGVIVAAEVALQSARAAGVRTTARPGMCVLLPRSGVTDRNAPKGWGSSVLGSPPSPRP